MFFFFKKKQRLETQLKYLQTNFDQLENTERRLMKEKRDAQREVSVFYYIFIFSSVQTKKKSPECVFFKIRLKKFHTYKPISL